MVDLVVLTKVISLKSLSWVMDGTIIFSLHTTTGANMAALAIAYYIGCTLFILSKREIDNARVLGILRQQIRRKYD